jgi:hypothetical protein
MVTMTLVNTDAKDPDMKTTNTVLREILEKSGWAYKGNCNCNGQYSDKYELPIGNVGEKYEMKVRRSTFLLRKPRQNGFTKIPISLLKQTVHDIQTLGQ